jgi:hypothetical protein
MWFKGFIVAALTASLTVGPFAGRLARADPPEAVNWEKVASEVAAVPGIELLPVVMADAKAALVSDIESFLDGADCGQDCAFGQLGPELDALFEGLFERERESGEFGFVISSELPLAVTVETTSRQSESVSFTKVTEIDSWDFTDPSIKHDFEANNYGVVTAIYEKMERAVLLVQTAAETRLVDAVMLHSFAGSPEEPASIIVIPVSSVVDGSGQAPPSLIATLTWWNWGCAFSGFAFALTLTHCLGGIGGCVYACLPCCVQAGRGCCRAIVAGLATWQLCVGEINPAVAGAAVLIAMTCAYIP